MLKKRRIELYEKNLKTISIEQFNADIDKSLEDSEKDRVISTKDLKAEMEI